MSQVVDLNDELFVSIVLKLPLQTIFQLRCVCKAWNTFLADNEFLKTYFDFLSQTPLYTVSLDDGFAAYSFETKSWHRWTSALHSRCLSRYVVYGGVGDWLLVEDESVKIDHRFQRLCLANQTKRSQRGLPRLPKRSTWQPSTVGLIPGERFESFKVFIVNEENFKEDGPEEGEDLLSLYQVYLYDIEVNSWKTTCRWQEAHLEFPIEFTKCVMFYEGTFHCIILKFHGDTSKNRKVYRYDESKSCWQELRAQISGELLSFEHLFEWQGHLMLVGGRIDRRDGRQHGRPRFMITSVHIWQLDKNDHVWVERMRMPDRILGHLYPSEFYMHDSEFSPTICGQYICFTSSMTISKDVESKSEDLDDDYGSDSEDSEDSKDSTDSKDVHKYRHVVCDLSVNLWWEVEEPPFLYDCLGFSLITPKI